MYLKDKKESERTTTRPFCKKERICTIQVIIWAAILREHSQRKINTQLAS